MTTDELKDELDGWKEIAEAVERSVRTAMYWGDRGMPVFKALGRVRARRSEILTWVRLQLRHVGLKPARRRRAA